MNIKINISVVDGMVKFGEKVVEKRVITSSDVYKELSNYCFDIISVFNYKYKMMPIKMQKLLFIAEMVMRKAYQKSLFPSNVYFESNPCGFKIPVLFDYISEFISIGETADEPIIPTCDENINITKIKNKYMAENIICLEGLEVINGVILEFGKFRPDTLGNLLNDFKNKEITDSEFFEKNTTFYFYSEEFDCLIKNIDILKGKNVVAEYILNYGSTADKR